jgi:hypothetical protein
MQPSCVCVSHNNRFSLNMYIFWCTSITVFPKVDFSHHPAISKILIKTCKDFDVAYSYLDPLTIYKEMIHSFQSPVSYMQEVLVYSGGV